MAKEIIVPVKLEGGEQAVKTIAQMETELQGMNEQLKDIPVNSQAFTEMSKKIATADAELKTVNNQLERLDPVKKAEQYVKLGEGIAGGFAIASGALASFGADQEKLAAIEAKAQGAVAIATGIRAIREGELFEIIKKSNVAKIASAAAEKLLAWSIGGTNVALKAFRVALIATGIGAIVVGLGLLIANFDKVKSVLGIGVNPATKKLAEVTIEAAEASKKAVEAFSLEERRLRALGATEKEITEQRVKRLKEAETKLNAAVEAQSKLVSEARKEGDKEEVDAAVEKYNELRGQRQEYHIQLLEIDAAARKKQADMEEQAEADYAADREARQEKAKADRDKRIEQAKEEAAEMKKVREEFAELAANQGLDQYELEIKAIEKTANEYKEKGISSVEVEKWKQTEITRVNEEAIAERQKLVIEQENALLEIARQNMLAAETDLRERALLELQIEKDKQLEQLKQYENYQELKEAIDIQYKEREEAINADFDEQAKARNKALGEAIQEQDKALRQAKVDIAASAVGALTSLNESFVARNKAQAKKQFNINKGLQIAGAAIDTYKSATSVYAATPGGPIIRGVAAGIAVVAGLVNINKIRQTKFDESGGGGSVSSSASSGGGGAASSGGGNGLQGVDLSFLGKGDVTKVDGSKPNENTPNNDTPTRAYVVSTDLTNQQAKDKKLNDLSKL